MQLAARLANVRALHAAFAMEYSGDDLRSPGMMPDISSPQQTFTWTSGEEIQVPDCEKSTVQVLSSAESSSNASASHYEIMTA